jgi:hypothetical protein
MQKYNSCPSCKKGANLIDIRPNFGIRDRISKCNFKISFSEISENCVARNEKEAISLKTTPELNEVPASWKKEIFVTASLKIPTLYIPPPTGTPSTNLLVTSPGYSEQSNDSTLPIAILAVVDITNLGFFVP